MWNILINTISTPLENNNIIYNDSPEPWGIGFQDGASPAFSGILDLHNSIFFI